MANSPTHSIPGAASQAATHAHGLSKEVEAMNLAAAIRHAGLLRSEEGKWQVLAEEPFREPPYWLLDPGT